MKLKVSEIAGHDGFYFSGKVGICLDMVLGYFPDLPRLSL